MERSSFPNLLPAELLSIRASTGFKKILIVIEINKDSLLNYLILEKEKEKSIKEKEKVGREKEEFVNNEKPSIAQRNLTYVQTARKLSRIIHSVKKIRHTPIQIKQWTNEIRQLVENNKVSLQRIEKVLEWYEKNIGGQYIPVIESGRSLREKFQRLEDAMKRVDYPKLSAMKPFKIYDGIKYNLCEDGKYRSKGGTVYIE